MSTEPARPPDRQPENQSEQPAVEPRGTADSSEPSSPPPAASPGAEPPAPEGGDTGAPASHVREPVGQVRKDRSERIQDVFAAMDKLIRGMKLYRGRGRLVDQMTDELERKVRMALEPGPFTLRVASFGLVYEGTPLLIEEKRIPYLFQLFCDGVRELTFLEEVTREELLAFVGVLCADVQGEEEEDLVTLLWKADLPHIRHYAADTFSAGFQVDESGEMVLAQSRASSRLAQEGSQEIALSPDDIRMLGGEDELSWVRKASAEIHATGRVAEMASRIREAFQTPRDIRRFVDLALRGDRSGAPGTAGGNALVLDLFDAFVGAGDWGSVLETLAAARACAQRAEARGEAGSAELRNAHALLDGLLLGSRLRRLAPAMKDHAEALMDHLEALVGRGREGLVALLTELEPGPAQSRLHEILAEAGVDLTGYYREMMGSEDEERVIHAIRSLGELDSPEAVQALAEGLGRTSTPIREAALRAMVGKYHPSARVGLARALRDPAKDNRLLALEVLGGSGDNRVAWGLLSTVQDASFAQKERDEQAAFYRALASFEDARILDHFKQILAQKNVLRKKSVTAVQLLAVEALASVDSEDARAVLGEFTSARFHPREVTDAIRNALRGGRGS